MTNDYLITWYGFADLRSALGLEASGGPILNALKYHDYSNILILGYTATDKGDAKISAKQNSFLSQFQSDNTGFPQDIDEESKQSLVDLFSNTPAAHRLFVDWLREEVRKLGLKTDIQLAEVPLENLNDIWGIYRAAEDALTHATQRNPDSNITFFLSPGTPVMAFMWAFVSMIKPDRKISVISSSGPRSAPVKIDVPHELLVPSSRRNIPQTAQSQLRKFDTLVHLVADERLPVALGIQQFVAKRHIFVLSKGNRVENLPGLAGPNSECHVLEVNATDPMSSKVQILKLFSEISDLGSVGFNLTGGTKLMFAGAAAACRDFGGTPFFFETRKNRTIFLDDFSSVDTRGLDTVDDFFRLYGFQVTDPGIWKEKEIYRTRRCLTEKLWKERELISHLYGALTDKRHSFDHNFKPFSVSKSVQHHGKVMHISASLNSNASASITLGNSSFDFTDCPDFAKYLCGGWLEEYAYLSLTPLLESGVIRDMRMGLTIDWEHKTLNSNSVIGGEFDVVLTDGFRLFIIECKAGKALKIDDLYKLKDKITTYGGIAGRGILLSAIKDLYGLNKTRVKKMRNIEFLLGDQVTQGLDRLISDIR
jgi:hypothetical protein